MAFDVVQLIGAGESKMNVIARPNGALNLREAIGLRHLRAVSSAAYQTESFEVPIRLTYGNPDGELYTDESFAFVFTYGLSDSAVDTGLVIRYRTSRGREL